MAEISAVRMPKWGLSMEEGTVVAWIKAEGAEVGPGEDLVEIETAKITNVAEAPAAGVLRRIVVQPGGTVPVGALIGILSDPDAPEAEIEAFEARFKDAVGVEAAADPAAALTRSQVEVDGETMAVGRMGAETGRAPCVLVHGWAGDLDGWLFNMEALAAGGPVIAIDLPGHGGSSKSVGDGSTAALARVVGAALSKLGVARAHLIGHSLGAAVVVRIAAARPELAETVTLIAPAHAPGGRVNAAFLDGVIEASRARSLKPVLELLVATPDAVTKTMVDDMIRFKRLDGVEEALSKTRDALLSPEETRAVQADMARLTDVLVIASHGDQIVGAPDPAQSPPGWTVRWIEAAGHLPHMEQAGEVNALLTQRVSRA